MTLPMMYLYDLVLLLSEHLAGTSAVQCCGFCHLGKGCSQLMLPMLHPQLYRVFHIPEQGRWSHSKLVSAGMSQTVAVLMNMIEEKAVAH